METTAALPSLFESSRRSVRKGPDRKTWQSSGGGSTPQGPWRPSRREFLGAAAAVLAGAAIFGVTRGRSSQPGRGAETPPQKSNLYTGWERYANRNLPRETVMDIARDLAADTEYPGFSEVGQMVVEANTRNGSIDPRIKPLSTVEDLRIGLLKDLSHQQGALARLEVKNTTTGIEGEFKPKGEAEFQQGFFTRVTEPNVLTVILDSSSYVAPEMAKKLLIVKEFSHLLLIAEHKKAIAAQVLQNFDVRFKNPAFDIEDVLYSSGQDKPDFNNIPSLTDLFNHTRIDWDGAGYWYVIRALGKMMAKGVFSSKDLDILNSNVAAFQAARKDGLLIEQGSGDYVWKQGIGPFSPEWTAIGRAVLWNRN